VAHTTDPALKNQTVYSVFVRNHSLEGNFAALTADLDRIAELGVDIIWLLPIHPIGEENRKGSAGSPYAIKDYRAINPEFGSLDDFISFLNAAHQRKLKVIIDVVFNHTSPDSLLKKVHPEWFWRNIAGESGNRIGEWSDVIDLDYAMQALWDYQIETLKGWLHHGVDGFRCDVAPLLPLAFWIEARDICATINPDTLWVAETLEGRFINQTRRMGFECLTDSETLRAFDVSYDYDVYPDWCSLVEKLKAWNGIQNADIALDVKRFVERLRVQESTLCDTDIKLRYLENHDHERVAGRLENPVSLRLWTAYSLFLKGMSLIYAGQEYAIGDRPSLFDPDPLNWDAANSDAGGLHQDFVAKLIKIKKSGIVRDGGYWYPEAAQGVIAAAYERRSPDGRLTGLRLGVFNVLNTSNRTWQLKKLWPELSTNPVFTDLIHEKPLALKDLMLCIGSDPLILDWGLTS